MAATAVNGGGAAAKAVGSTAGLNFSNLAGLGGLGGLPNLTGIGPGAWAPPRGPSDPLAAAGYPAGSYVYVNGRVPGMEYSQGGLSYNADGTIQMTPAQQLAAMAQDQAGQQQNQSGAGGSAGPSLSDVLGGLLGSAPTMSDFFNPSTYQSALQGLATGQKTAASSIGNAYDQAAQFQKQIDALASQNTANEQSLLNQDMANASSQVNNAVSQAQAFGGQGGQLGARLSAMQANLAEQQAQEKMMNQQLAGVQQYNTTQGESALTASRANALAALASAAQGATNKISTTEAADQNKANAQYQRALQTYGAQRAKYLTAAQKGLQSSGQLGGSDWAKQSLSDWQARGAQGDQNAAALANVATQLVLGSSDAKDGALAKPAHNFADATNRLALLAPLLGSSNSIMYGVLNNWLQNYYGASKTNLSGGASSQDMANWLLQNYG